ncbi:MAG TPA: DUF3830 family protein [Candidatus Limnocylindria bacterium]|nr:DUF3830 family protein [Candidatus Limnocylindria bacterium]
MTARFLDIRIGEIELRALLLDERAPVAAAALWSALPLAGRARHDDWSGELARLHVGLAPSAIADLPVPYQHPQLIVLDPATGDLAIAYGQGRLQNGFGPLPAVPVAAIGADVAPLAGLLRQLQFTGAAPVRITASTDQRSPLAEAPRPPGHRLHVRLGDASVAAVFLESVSPKTAAAFRALLPLSGTGTNTHSSGPLVRFWNPAGGPEGETPLAVEPPERGEVVLRPGYLYYFTSPPWRGVRIAARDATVMRNAIAGSSLTRLTPFAAFVGDWSGFRAEAERLQDEGAKPLRFEGLPE